MREPQAHERAQACGGGRTRIRQPQLLLRYREYLLGAVSRGLQPCEVDVTGELTEEGAVAQYQLARIRTAKENLKAVQVRTDGQRIHASQVKALIDRRTLAAGRAHTHVLE